jgi:hypothetical protein
MDGGLACFLQAGTHRARRIGRGCSFPRSRGLVAGININTLKSTVITAMQTKHSLKILLS